MIPFRYERVSVFAKTRCKRWMWIDRAFRSGRTDSGLVRKQRRASLDASVSPKESLLQPLSWNCLREIPVRTASCLVEVELPRGANLRLELKAIPTSALAELIRAFAA